LRSRGRRKGPVFRSRSWRPIGRNGPLTRCGREGSRCVRSPVTCETARRSMPGWPRRSPSLVGSTLWSTTPSPPAAMPRWRRAGASGPSWRRPRI
jgi:hypothetical protein